MGSPAPRRPRRPGRLASSIAAVALILAPACSRGGDKFPPAPAVIDVAMREYRFDYRAPRSAGRLVFRVRNDGTLAHNLVLIALDEEIPPLDQQLRGSERLLVPTVASLPSRGPRRSGTFAVDLGPGRYGFVCFVQDPDGQQHAQKGMSSEFRVS